MARSDAIWGIDIGQCALKALRCRADDNGKRMVAEAFDYIEYPTLLSQPGADTGELIADALKTFLSRNNLRGDRVAVSVSGQAGLARFIKLPPVEARKIPKLVSFEAKQQIPFDLNDVIWDYQRLGGGVEEEGFALETEIGLFAMKREAAFRSLEPFRDAGIEVDYLQLAPLCIYNYVLFDLLADLPTLEEYDPDNPPPSVVVIAVGTDNTDLVITNGFRVWQRSVPLGGNHFTKALTKELKLTFAKAEHLKRNAQAAADPKAAFQAMRPVFNDFLTELQRSIGYFTSIDRAAQIGRVVALGNAMKLPGLRRYLSQNLGYEIERVDQFSKLTGAQVLAQPAFKDNLLTFGVCYGLCLQGLEMSGLRTNLLPKEILKDRLVKQKKPWAVAAAALLLAACGITYASYSMALGTADTKTWKPAEDKAVKVTKDAKGFRDEADAARNQYKAIDEIGKHLVGNVEGRVLWAEFLKVVNDCLPRYTPRPTKDIRTSAERREEITSRDQLFVTNLECQYVEKLEDWFKGVEDQWNAQAEQFKREGNEGLLRGLVVGSPDHAAATAPSAPSPASPGQPNAGPAATAPTGPGWIVRISGYHFHNRQGSPDGVGADFVRNTLVRNLLDPEREKRFPSRTARSLQTPKPIELPGRDGQTPVKVSPRDIGIMYPVQVRFGKLYEVTVEDRDAAPATPAATPGAPGVAPLPGLPRPGGVLAPGTGLPGAASAADPNAVPRVDLPAFDFEVQMCWKKTPPSEREKAAATVTTTQ